MTGAPMCAACGLAIESRAYIWVVVDGEAPEETWGRIHRRKDCRAAWAVIELEAAS